MLTKEGIEHGRIVRTAYRKVGRKGEVTRGATLGQSPIVAAAAVADGRADILDADGKIIEPTRLGVQQGRRVVEMLAIDPGPQYPFFILPQAPRNNALAAKILPR